MTKAALLRVLGLRFLFMPYILSISGSEDWDILSRNYICAMTGSSVVMPCSFTPPAGHTVTEVFWVVGDSSRAQPSDLSMVKNYAGRVKYYWDENRNKNNCTLELNNVKMTDSTMYKVRIITDKNKWLSRSFVQLSVRDVLNAWSGQDWVTLTNQYICAVTGSSVDMPCSLTPQAGQNATNIFWVHTTKGIETTDLHNNPSYTGRVQYYWDKKNTNNSCTLKLTGVKTTDSSRYKVRIITNRDKWLSHAFVQLTVRDLTVLVPEMVVEGSEVRLSCTIRCRLENEPAFIWRKNGEDLHGKQIENSELLFTSVSKEDEGDYSCALKGHEGHPSKPVKFNVMYPPKNTSVSVSPAGEIIEGASVTLTCISDANPPVENYTWYTRNETVPPLVGSDQIYRINKIISEPTGYYYCVAKNEHGVSESTDVLLNVQYAPKTISASVGPFAEILEGTSVTLTCSCDANPPAESYTWYRQTGSAISKIAAQQIYNISEVSSEHTGHYYCQAKNKHGHTNSTIIHLEVICFGWQRAVLFAFVGLVPPVIILLGLGLVYWRRRRTTTNFVSGNTDKETQDPQEKNPGAVCMSSVYESLNPKTVQHDDIYQSLNPNTSQPNALDQSLNPNTIQPDDVYQNFNPNTFQF